MEPLRKGGRNRGGEGELEYYLGPGPVHSFRERRRCLFARIWQSKVNGKINVRHNNWLSLLVCTRL